jgi:hypothetical protein
VGRPKESGQGTQFFEEQNMVCCHRCFMKSEHLNLCSRSLHCILN